jgi:hypothetical protein
MPRRPELPPTLERFGRALEDCCRSRLVQKTVKFESRLRGREVKSREQLHAVVAELEERIGSLLDQGHRVRIIRRPQHQWSERYFRLPPFANLKYRLHKLPNLSCNHWILQSILQSTWPKYREGHGALSIASGLT